MSDAQAGGPGPLTLHLVVRGAERAARWYAQVFGARPGRRLAAPDGRFMEIELRFGPTTIMIADEFPEFGVVSPLALGGTYGALHIATDDVDTLWQRTLDHGASVHQPLGDVFWGERHGQVIDPFGHRWGLSQHLRDMSDEELAAGVAAMFAGEPA